MEQERDPRQVPIHIAFGDHSNGSRSGIDWLRKTAQNYLDSQPCGKVVWILEAADVTDDVFNNLQARRDDGLKSQLDSLPGLKREGKTFTSSAVKAIEDLDSRYPKRVILTTEHRNELEVFAGELANNLITSNPRFRELCENGKFDEALPFFKHYAGVQAAMIIKDRDEHFVKNLKQEAEYPNTVAVVGHLGAVHTGVYHALRKDGYNISRFFTEKGDDYLVYPPLAVILRTLAYSPKTDISDEQWLKALLQHTVYSVLERRRMLSLRDFLPTFNPRVLLGGAIFLMLQRLLIPSVPKTGQGVRKLLYTVTRNLDAEDVMELGKKINDSGITTVVGDLVRPYRKRGF